MEVQVGGLSDGLGLDASPSVSGPLFGRAPKAIIGAIAVAVVLVMALSGGDDDGGSGGGAGAGTEAATSGMPAVDCASSTAGAILGACGASPAGPKATSVMFSGNSFTYGPPHKYPDYVPDGGALNNLPRLFKLVADSLGDPVDTYEDTIGGCTNYAHRPTACPLQADGVSIAPGCERVVSRPVSYSDHVLAADGHVTSGPVHGFPRVRNDATMGLTWAELNQCAIPCAHGTGGGGGPPAQPSNCSSGIAASRGTYHPCPQMWNANFGPKHDFMVFQTHSALPGIAQSRELMMKPAAAEMAAQARAQGATLVAYMTWGYPNGSGVDTATGQRGGCPGGSKAGCFPDGWHGRDLSPLSGTNCDTSDEWEQVVGPFDCQGYSVGRGYADLLEQGDSWEGVGLVAPAGLAWQVARGAAPPSEACLRKIDPQYRNAVEPAYLDVLRGGGDCCGVSDADKVASGPACTPNALKLYRDKGPRRADGTSDYNSNHYCAPGTGTTDHHPSLAGMYLNSLVMYATLFGKSPIGAAWPDGQIVNGEALPVAQRHDGGEGGRPGPVLMDAPTALSLQKIAHAVVLGADGRRRSVWQRQG